MTSMYDVLKANKGVPVDDMFAELWGRKLSGDYGIVTYTGTLPATLTGTKAGYLHGYKIYGNTEQTGTPTPSDPIVPSECGERTENLFDYSAKDTSNGYVDERFLTANGVVTYNKSYYITEYIRISSETTYRIKNILTSGAACAVCFYDENKDFLSGLAEYYNPTFLTPATSAYLRLTIQKSLSNGMLTESSTVPASYIPYGYKLPLLSGSTPVDIYIGNDTLSDAEYIDSGTGKIYRMVDDVLTPVDPPVPFPAIPTSANSTTISWAGEGLAPSQVEFEYERK